MKFDVLTKAGNAITRFGSRTILQIRKYSPEILMGIGVIGVGIGVVECCRATRKLDDILAEREETMKNIERAHEVASDPEMSEAVKVNYTEQDYKTDLIKVNARTVRDLVKNYAPGAILVASGVGCFFGAYGILHARNVALAASYAALSEAFENYKQQARNIFGNEVDEGVKEALVDQQDPENPDNPPFTPNHYSPYAKVFKKTSIWWRPSLEHNRTFLINAQNRMNDKLNRQGHLFLNEVYDALDMPRSQAGAIVGWIKNNPNGNGFVDFNLFTSNDKARRFIDGDERNVWVDFNVDGIIYNMI